MWLSLTLVADAADAERLCEALLARGALSVSLEDADAGTARELARYGEPGAADCAPWPRSRLNALLPAGADPGRLMAECAADLGLERTPEHSLDRVADCDWVRLSRAQFEPIRVGRRLWIVPSWHRPPDPNAVNIALDPGAAFGTGSHATTQLCLEWLENNVMTGNSMLDYGCGSGILAIAAARLGAGRLVGVDLDPDALRAAADNARRNGVSIRWLDCAAPLAGRFDLVVANILAKPLCLLAPALVARIAPGGKIALAGVLESQIDGVVEAYAPYLALAPGAAREGWVRLDGTRE
jgi:ribosomal protein L11 methyltransferase